MKTLKLFKVLLKNFEMISVEKKQSKFFFMIIGIITMLIIFIPATYYIFYLTKMLTSALDSVGFSSSGLNFILYVISMFTIVFSFNVVLNTMYNSKDIEYLRSLPFKQEQISLAKLLYLTFTESMIQFMFIIGAFIGFFYIIGFDVFRVIIMIIGLLTIPIIPVCYCAIICLIARALSSTIKILPDENKFLYNQALFQK